MAAKGEGSLAETRLLADETLAALEGHQVIVTLAESGGEHRGKLAAFTTEWLELSSATGNTLHLYRHAIGAIRAL